MIGLGNAINAIDPATTNVEERGIILVGLPPRVVEVVVVDRLQDGDPIRVPFLLHALGQSLLFRPVVDAPVLETNCQTTTIYLDSWVSCNVFFLIMPFYLLQPIQPTSLALCSLAPGFFCDGQPRTRTTQSRHTWGHGDGRAAFCYAPRISPFLPNPRHRGILPIGGQNLRPSCKMEAERSHPRYHKDESGPTMRTAQLCRLRIRFLWA